MKPLSLQRKTLKRNDVNRFKLFLIAITDPLTYLVDKSSKTILDLGCGQGKPMAMIKLWKKFDYAVGVDLYAPYIKEARELKLHNKYLIKDIRKVNFNPKSFDIVLASHVLEHLPKKEGWKVLQKMERIARRQVIIVTPIGKIYQPMFDNNYLQKHRSFFLPEEFEHRGYKTVRYGRRWLLDEYSEGLIYKVKSPHLRRVIYIINFLATPIYYIFPNICDYSFIAYKKI